MSKHFTFGSVCSGIEAASVAWHPLGWKAAWLSEIEPFPCAVLAHHYPNVPNLGDMTTLPDRILSGEIEAPDLFCGGTPCQAFSVAGLRNSLEDARGNLSLTFVGIANAIDHVRSVRSDDAAIIFWENVPGVLNTKDNAFGCFLGALAGEDDPVTCPDGKWPTAGVVVGQTRTVAWRVLDAQYFGVAQRRRRVFVVASARDDFDPAAVLFEFEGLRRDIAPSRQTGQNSTSSPRASLDFSGVSTVAGTLTANTGGLTRPAGNANELDFCVPIKKWPADIASTLDTSFGTKQGLEDQHVNAGCPLFVPVISPCLETQVGGLRQPCTQAYVVTPPLTASMATPLGNGGKDSFIVPIAFSRTDNGRDATMNLAPTMRCAGRAGGTLGVAQPMPINTMIALRHEALGRGTGFGIGEEGDPAYTLTKGHSHAVAQPMAFDLAQITSATNRSKVDPSLPSSTISKGSNMHVANTMAVRRLTPVECERLQGFPDNYTNIPWRKNDESPDGPRYKALGNSWAVPVVAWIGSRIAVALKQGEKS
jgi:DNA (cytosine-5)-methyltransferase 1